MATAWLPGPWPVPPLEGEVHVWRAELRAPGNLLERMGAHLDATERDRAGRFVFPHLRERFVIAHGVLREILASYAALDPSSVMFQCNAHGKPALEASGGVARLRFNLSHSEDLALIAVALDRELGIDVEKIRGNIETEKLAERFFSHAERQALLSVDPMERVSGFFRCWTRKEAYIKAKGLGLAIPLDQFDVSLDPGPNASLLRTLCEPDDESGWSLWDLDPGCDSAGAVAVQGRGLTLRTWAWFSCLRK